MNHKNILITNSIKEEYLPPPLEKNYLSLFDIQVKMTKEFLPGSEEEKIAIIKRRIKKFFDYGNQQKAESSTAKRNKLTSPCQIDNTKLKEGLKIDCSKIIVYGSEMTTYQTAEKMFPGFIGFQKIDDSNIKLSFSKKQECQKLLIKNSKDPNSILTDYIMNPQSIEWFELQYEIEEENLQDQVKEVGSLKKQTRKYYARYVTNKDNLLLGNQSYFRKLLGKARSLIEQKESQSLMREKQAEAATELKMPKTFKRKFIKRNFKGKKHHRVHFETETNYDGFFGEERQRCFYNNQEQINFRSRDYGNSFDQRYPHHSRHHQLEKLDLSDIRPIPIDLEDYSRDIRKKSRRQPRKCSNDPRDHMVSSKPQGKCRMQSLNLRDQMIKQYREKEFSNSQANVQIYRSGETNRFSGRNKATF